MVLKDPHVHDVEEQFLVVRSEEGHLHGKACCVSQTNFVQDVSVPNRATIQFTNDRDVRQEKAAARDALKDLCKHGVACLTQVHAVRL